MLLELSIQKPRKRRAKTGCMNCRRKHKKCDETKPACSSCIKKSETCEWPDNNGRLIRHHTSSSTGFIENKEIGSLDKYADRLINSFDSKSTNFDNPGSQPERKYSSSLSNDNLNCMFPDSTISKSSSLVSRFNNRISPNNYTAGQKLLSPVLNTNKGSMQLKVHLNQMLKKNSSSTNNKENVSTIDPRPNHQDNQVNERLGVNAVNQIHRNNKPGFDSINKDSNYDKLIERGSNHFNRDSTNNDFDNYNNKNTVGPPASKTDKNSTYSFSPQDELAPFLLYNDLHNTLRDYMFTNAELNDVSKTANLKNILYSPAPNFLAKNFSKNLQEFLDNATSNADKESDENSNTGVNKNITKVNNILNGFKAELTRHEELELFKNYLYEIAPWLDMFDNSKQFGTTVADLSQTNKSLLYAIYAISSRQKEQVESNYPPKKTINLYQESLKYLIPTVNKIMDKGIISSCVILCVFEIMSSSPKEWRHHLEGCHALFEANDINGFSGELERRLFWCYSRMDVNSAVIGEQSTIIPSENWLPKGSSVYELKRLFLETNDDDMYANYIVFLCSRVLSLISKEIRNFEEEWEFLWNEIIDWNLNRPFHLKPILSYDDKPFPGVLFLNGPAISANQLFHMAIILLTQNKPRLYKIKPTACIKSTIWHAKQICAVSIHNSHHGCWNNALQPLWIAGKLLSSEHEHEIILNLLDKIESTTGWQMKFRKNDLKKYWNGLIVE